MRNQRGGADNNTAIAIVALVAVFFGFLAAITNRDFQAVIRGIFQISFTSPREIEPSPEAVIKQSVEEYLKNYANLLDQGDVELAYSKFSGNFITPDQQTGICKRVSLVSYQDFWLKTNGHVVHAIDVEPENELEVIVNFRLDYFYNGATAPRERPIRLKLIRPSKDGDWKIIGQDSCIRP